PTANGLPRGCLSACVDCARRGNGTGQSAEGCSQTLSRTRSITIKHPRLLSGRELERRH
ncbi:hypothetical protein BGY98DRAFT_1045498, partial [Russula aff. rugulosa BPL654]